jgi:hypothetical protein
MMMMKTKRTKSMTLRSHKAKSMTLRSHKERAFSDHVSVVWRLEDAMHLPYNLDNS